MEISTELIKRKIKEHLQLLTPAQLGFFSKLCPKGIDSSSNTVGTIIALHDKVILTVESNIVKAGRYDDLLDFAVDLQGLITLHCTGSKPLSDNEILANIKKLKGYYLFEKECKKEA